MHPDESPCFDAFLTQHLQLLERQLRGPRVRRDGETARPVRPRRRPYQLAMQVGQCVAADTDLDEAWPDLGAVDALAPLLEPAVGQLVGGFGEGVPGQKLVVRRTVVEGVTSFGITDYSPSASVAEL